MTTRRAKNALLLTCFLLISSLITACGKKSTADGQEEKEEVIPVTVIKSQKMKYTPLLRFSGNAEESRKAALGTTLPGRVEKVYCSKGSFVQKGKLLVEMSDEMLLQAQIENDAIKRDFERISRLRDKESISQMEYDHVKAKYDASVAKVALLKKNTSIVAPFSGIVTDILVNEGENYIFVPTVTDNLKVKEGVLEICQVNPLKVVLKVNEKEINSLNIGQNVIICFDAMPTDSIIGKINFISPVLSELTRTASVEVSIPNPKLRLKPGMYCNVSVELPEREGVFVPLNTIYRLPGTADEYVFKLNEDGQTVTRIQVQRAEMNEGMVRVDGINEGDTIIVDGKNKLHDGSTVNVVKE